MGGADDVALVPFGPFADVDEPRAVRRQRLASAGPTSGTSARASRSRSDRERVMSEHSGWVWRGRSGGRAPDDMGGRVGEPVRPARYSRTSAIMPAPPSRPRRVAGTLRERTLEGVQREQGALQARRADIDAQQLQDVVLGQLASSAVVRPRRVSVSMEADAWLMAQPRPVNATSVTVPDSSRSSISVSRSPHNGLAPSYETSGSAACRSCAAAGSAPGSRPGTGHPWDVTG